MLDLQWRDLKWPNHPWMRKIEQLDIHFETKKIMCMRSVKGDDRMSLGSLHMI